MRQAVSSCIARSRSGSAVFTTCAGITVRASAALAVARANTRPAASGGSRVRRIGRSPGANPDYRDNTRSGSGGKSSAAG